MGIIIKLQFDFKTFLTPVCISVSRLMPPKMPSNMIKKERDSQLAGDF